MASEDLAQSLDKAVSINCSACELLGRGGFGEVYKWHDVESGQGIAVKRIPIPQTDDLPNGIEELEREIKVMSQIQHERLVKFFGHQKDSKYLYMLLEYMSEGSLKDKLLRDGAFTEDITKRYAKQILQGLVYLHDDKRKIIHRDLKCANILRDGSDNVKIGDFGISEKLHTVGTASGLKQAVGTWHWMSPEMLTGEGYGRKTDIWSFGCTMVEMLTKTPPWKDYSGVLVVSKIVQANAPDYELPEGISVDVNVILEKTFKKVSDRPTANELLQNPFFAGLPTLNQTVVQAPLSKAHRDALGSCRAQLLESMDVDYILATCVEKQVISQRMKENIETKTTREKKCSAFLDILLTRGQQAFKDFIAVLSVDYLFLAVPLEKELHAKALNIAKTYLSDANEIMLDNGDLEEDEVKKLLVSLKDIRELTAQLRTKIGIPKSVDVLKVEVYTKAATDSHYLPDAHKATLRSQRVVLEENLDVEYILPGCIQEGVLSQAMKEKVLAHPTRQQRCSAFLDVLETRSKQAFDNFVSFLQEDYRFLQLILERDLRKQALLLAANALTNAIFIFDHEVPSVESESTKVALESIDNLISQLQNSLMTQEMSTEDMTVLSIPTCTISMVPTLASKMSALEIPSTSSSYDPPNARQISNISMLTINLTWVRAIELPDACFGLSSSPTGNLVLSIDEHGIFVYDKIYNLTRRFPPKLPFYKSLFKSGRSSNTLNAHDVACLPTDEIVISSMRNNWVKVYDMKGNFTQQICMEVNGPNGVAFHEQLGIVVIGNRPQCLIIYSSDYQLLRTIRNKAFKKLLRVAINPYNKTLLVTDGSTNTLHCLDWEGEEQFVFNGVGDDRLQTPNGICVTEEHLLLADLENHRVLLLSHDGDLIQVLLTEEDHDMWFPGEVTVDRNGNIIVGECHMAQSRSNLLHVFKVEYIRVISSQMGDF